MYSGIPFSVIISRSKDKQDLLQGARSARESVSYRTSSVATGLDLSPFG